MEIQICPVFSTFEFIFNNGLTPAKERVLATIADDELAADVKRSGLASLKNLYLSGDLAHSTSYGPDCAGVSTVRGVVAGGKLLIAVDATQLLSFYQCPGIGIIVQIEILRIKGTQCDTVAGDQTLKSKSMARISNLVSVSSPI